MNPFIRRLPVILTLLVIVFGFAMGIRAYPALPELSPSHWNAAGEVDGWSGPFSTAFFLPLMTLAMFPFLHFIVRADSRWKNASEYAIWGYRWITFIVILFLTVIHMVAVSAAVGYAIDMNKTIGAAMGSLFLILGGILLFVAQPGAHLAGINLPPSPLAQRGASIGMMVSGLLTIVVAFAAPKAVVWVALGASIALVPLVLVLGVIGARRGI